MKLYDEGKYAQAFEIFEQVKMQTEKEFGKENKDYALSCTDLANSYFAQGLYAKAQPSFIEATKYLRKKLGKEHSDYAASCNNLANLSTLNRSKSPSNTTILATFRYLMFVRVLVF